MPETSQTSPEGVDRTPTGEIVDQTPKPTETSTTTTTSETVADPAATKTADSAETKKDESLLNKKDGEGAPEKYEDFKVPDGYTLDAEVAKEASGLFKGMNLNQAQAQSLVDFYVAKTTEAAEAPFKTYTTMREDWVNQVKSDAEIGPRLAQVKATVSRALDSLGDPKLAGEFRSAMDLTGAGDHPAFIKAFYKLAQRVTEGTHVSGSGPSKLGQARPGEGVPSAARALYPNLT